MRPKDKKNDILSNLFSRRSFLSTIGLGVTGLGFKKAGFQSRLEVEEISWKSEGNQGVVAAGEKPSVQAGMDILKKGGNAADSAVSTILAQTITEYGSFCIGSELVFMFYDEKSKQVKVLSGQGAAPSSKEAIDWYIENGIPANDIKAAAIPAVIDLCVTALQLYGTMSFNQTVQSALLLLDTEEEVWYQDLAVTFRKLVEAEMNSNGNREQKLQAVSDRFYRGDIAESLHNWYKKEGGFLTREDLANHITHVEEPVSVDYKGYTVYKANSHTQGPVMLQVLRLLENFDLKEFKHLSTKYIHTVTESFKLSLADRDTFYGDPLFVKVPIKELLSDEYTKLRYKLIDPKKASDEFRPGDPINMKALSKKGAYKPIQTGTTTCSIIDKWGNMVAATPSGWGSNADFGGGTGIKHGTRLLSFNTMRGHPNCIEPGKRPLTTLTPTLVLKDGKPVMAMTVEGGDVQDQTSVNIFLSIIEFNMKPYEALSAPRFATNLHEDSFNPSSDRTKALPSNPTLTINKEGQCEVGCFSELKKLGHHVVPASSSGGAIGTPAVIYVNQRTGIAYGATDPKTPHYTGAIE